MGRLPSTQPLPGLTPPSPQSTMTSRLIRSLPPTWPTARTLLPPRPSFRLLSTLPWQEVWLPSRPPPQSPHPSSLLASLTVSLPSMPSLPSIPSQATPTLLLDSHTALLGFQAIPMLVCLSLPPPKPPKKAATCNQNTVQTIHRLSE